MTFEELLTTLQKTKPLIDCFTKEDQFMFSNEEYEELPLIAKEFNHHDLVLINADNLEVDYIYQFLSSNREKLNPINPEEKYYPIYKVEFNEQKYLILTGEVACLVTNYENMNNLTGTQVC